MCMGLPWLYTWGSAVLWESAGTQSLYPKKIVAVCRFVRDIRSKVTFV